MVTLLSSVFTIFALFAGAKPFLCPHCNQRFRTSGQRKSHINAQHVISSSNVNDEFASAAAIQSGLIPLTIPAASMTQALDAVTSAGEPLLGATVRLQLHGSGLENAIAQLQVNDVQIILQLSGLCNESLHFLRFCHHSQVNGKFTL